MLASAEHTPISKELLAEIHRCQLMNGKRNTVHQEAIVDALGGIDDILQNLLTSNAVLDEPQLDSLRMIIEQNTINAVSQPQEDKAHITITYTFREEDSFLFTVFGQENGEKILRMLNGKIIQGILLILFGVAVIVTGLNILSVASHG
eukprot:928101_1